MADEQNPTGETTPPKIKLGLSSTGIPPREAVPPIQIRPTEKKAETTRIDISMAQKPIAPIASVGDTQPVQPNLAIPNTATVRVEKPATPPKAETQKVGPAALNTTMRVEVAEQRKTETTRINIPAEAFQKTPGTAPRATAPTGAEEIFKRTTIPVGIPTPPPTQAARPKTISVKRPVTVAADKAETVISPSDKAVADARKSETARIDLPADVGGERPATRPKTIRIKRPDGTSARKALTIARPDSASADGEEPEVPMPVVGESDEEAGGLFSVLALVAVLVTCVVIYVLAAQSIAPNLPWPGRL